jgi:hypothetical protein
VYEPFSDAFDISTQERVDLNIADRTEFTYGEIEFYYFLPVLNLVSPSAGEVFWDLGCGLAKPMVAATLAYPYLKAVKGVELL